MLFTRTSPTSWFLSPRVEVDLNVHQPHLTNCLATIMAHWDTATLLHLAKP